MSSRKYVVMIMYDLPSKKKNDIKQNRKFRKEIMKYGYYQLQQSIYCCSFNEKEQCVKSISNLKKLAPRKGEIRGLILTNKNFEKMYIIKGKYNIAENILLKRIKILEF